MAPLTFAPHLGLTDPAAGMFVEHGGSLEGQIRFAHAAGFRALEDNFYDEIAYVQFADNPGRGAPGTGELHAPAFFGALQARDYRGIVGIEHGHRFDGLRGEEDTLARYAALERSLRGEGSDARR